MRASSRRTLGTRVARATLRKICPRSCSNLPSERDAESRHVFSLCDARRETSSARQVRVSLIVLFDQGQLTIVKDKTQLGIATCDQGVPPVILRFQQQLTFSRFRLPTK